MQHQVNAFNKQYHFAFLWAINSSLGLYEFLIYALMASYIATNFFPFGDMNHNLFLVLLVFALGYWSRAFGGWFLKKLRPLQEKNIISPTPILASIMTMLVGLLPTYQSIGFFAPFLLIILRIFQGMTMGYVPKVLFLIERMSKKNNLGLVSSIFCMATPFCIGFAGLVIAILNFLIPLDDMYDWGWRVPFLLSGFLGVINYKISSYYYQLGVVQPISQCIQSLKQQQSWYKSFDGSVLLSVLAIAPYGVILATFGIYIPYDLTILPDYPPIDVAKQVAIAFIVQSPITILAGFCCDLFPRKYLHSLFLVFSLLVCYPAINYIYSSGANLKWIIMICAFISCIAAGMGVFIFMNSFKRETISYRKIVLGYGIGSALFMGMTPAILVWLHIKGYFIVSYYTYIAFVSGLSLLASFFMPHNKKQVNISETKIKIV